MDPLVAGGCGNGYLEPGEECDVPLDASGVCLGDSSACADCTGGCQWSSEAIACGNGVVNAELGEECDDDNGVDGDGCSSACLSEPCPDDDDDGETTCAGDCDDRSGSIHPGAAEQPGNGIDEDCDHRVDETEVPASGSTLTFDGVSVAIPDGALDTPVEVTVEAIENHAHLPQGLPGSGQALGPAFAFRPHGLTFAAPVIIEIPYSVEHPRMAVLRLDNEVDRRWEVAPGGQFADGVARIEVTSFSSYMVGTAGTDPLCELCSDDAQCGGAQDRCVPIRTGANVCGTYCEVHEECPEGFLCGATWSNGVTVANQCVPGTGDCAGCFDADGDGYGYGFFCIDQDCHPDNRLAYPGSRERCIGAVDYDCDGDVGCMDSRCANHDGCLACGSREYTTFDVDYGFGVGTPAGELFTVGLTSGFQRAEGTEAATWRRIVQLPALESLGFTKMWLGRYMGCGLRDAEVECWGEARETGTNSGCDSWTFKGPTPLPLPSPVYDVSIGVGHACAVAGPDRRVYCWSGWIPVPQGGLWSHVAWRSCGAAQTNGLIDVGLTAVDDVEVSGHTSCAISGGQLRCWRGHAWVQGAVESSRQAGWDDSALSQISDVLLEDVRSVAPDYNQICAIRNDGTLWCAGSFPSGLVGNTDPLFSTTMQQIPRAASARDLCAVSHSACVVYDDGTVECWGYAARELRGSSSDSSPITVPDIDNAVAVGCYPSCVLTRDNRVICWGQDAPVPDPSVPTPIELPASGELALTNDCGGCEDLAAAKNDACGECGVLICGSADELLCDDPGLNACGGCSALTGTLDEPCGACGQFQCVGTELMHCYDPGANLCGGCTTLAPPLNSLCGECGSYVCDGTDATVCADPGLNGCGGCATLSGAPGTTCGGCGSWVCSSTNSVVCDASACNACGGTATLTSPPGTACGECGAYVCDGTDAVQCQDPGLNLCGGCAQIGSSLGDPCGICGTVVCETSESYGCDDPGDNGCGGCGALPAAPGDFCGTCGSYACDGTDAVVCTEGAPNACGGCATLSATPADSCGTCGVYECSGTNAVVCNDPGDNGCGGCSSLVNSPGTDCGAECGQYICSGTDATVCDEWQYNACGGCTTLASEPGWSCGGCAVVVCNGLDDTVCEDRPPNACGGCTELTAAPGDSCGTCGTVECDGTNFTTCNDPGANACGGCTTLSDSVGAPCNVCGTYACSGTEQTFCDESQCPEDCADGLDNDTDGDIDCNDADCDRDPLCAGPEPCFDGVLNGTETATDCGGDCAGCVEWSSIAVGTNDHCGTRSDGRVQCWGNDLFSTPAESFAVIDIGHNYACGIRSADNTIACWGASVGGVPVPTGAFTKVAVGLSHGCGVRQDGAIQCWGYESATEVSGVPTGTFTDVDVHEMLSCGLRSDGVVLCWGSSANDRTAAPAGTFVDVAAGAQFGCAIRSSDGRIECWGIMASAPIPDDAYASIAGGWGLCALNTSGSAVCVSTTGAFYAPPGQFSSIVGFEQEFCGVRQDGTAVCWKPGAPASSTFVPRSSYADVDSAGQRCARFAGGRVRCWLGTNPETGPRGRFAELEGGTNFGCGLRTSGQITCWGANDYGQATPPAGNYVELALGTHFGCARDGAGNVSCWGRNDVGQLNVPPGETFTNIATGYRHACGVTSSGTTLCWGNNQFGEATPIAGAYVELEAGGYVTCGRTVDGTVTCWGSNTQGQTQVPSGAYLRLEADDATVCGTRTDGTLLCWGAEAAPAGLVPAEFATACAIVSGEIRCWGLEALSEPQ